MMVVLFQNKKIRDKYLPNLVPQIFLDRKKRYVSFIMKRLHASDKEVIPENVIIKMGDNADIDMHAFRAKHMVPTVEPSEVFDMSTDFNLKYDPNDVEIAYEYLLTSAFTRFVHDALYDMEDYNSYNFTENTNKIAARARGIIKVNDILRGNVNKGADTDQLQDAMNEINSDDEIIRTSSESLNSIMGGFTRGYVDTVGAKSGHCKSSWTDYNVLQNTMSNKTRKTVIVTPEESATTRIRRMFAMTCGISTTAMREKTVKITEEHVKTLDSAMGGRIEIIDKYDKMKDIIDIMDSLDDDVDMFYLDHINGVDYPGTSTHLNNMVGNIPGLIQREKKVAKEKKIGIVNLSQVKDKDIMTSDRLLKWPRYWDLYASSVLYQAARELIMIWYPLKDADDMPTMSAMGNSFDPNEIIIRVEKSSFSTLGNVHLNFNPAFNTFTDKSKKGGSKSIKAPAEDSIQSSMFS